MGKWIRKTVQKFTDTETYTMLPDSMRMRLSMLSVAEEPLQLHVGSAELDSSRSSRSSLEESLASNDDGAVAAQQHGRTISTGTIIHDNPKSDNNNNNSIIIEANSMEEDGLKRRSPKSVKSNNSSHTDKEANDNDNHQNDNDNKKIQRPRKLCSACTITATLRTKYDGYKHSATLFLREQLHWKYLKVCQLLCVVYIVIYTYGGFDGATVRQADTGFIVDPYSEERTHQGIILSKNDDGTTTERAIVATSTFQLVCLSLARITAFYMYPTLVLIFFSKLRATANFVAQTPFGMFLYDDWHDLHVSCGWSIFVNSVLHTVFHVIRYYDQGTMELMVTNRSGLSGLIIFVALLLVCLPMMNTRLKQCLHYEVRKGMHYFFYVFAIALMFHAPASALPNGGFAPIVFGTLILWYFLDMMYCMVFMSERIDTTVFDVLPSGVQMTLAVSERYNTSFTGGYCYICLPWVDKTQWHAFSLFEHPTNPALKQVFMLKNGDWTNKVHAQLERDTVRPVWIQGPYLSPYNRSVDYDNQIMVASGIGITPALSVIRSQKDSRRTNLIWCVRDPALLEFFLERAYLDHSGWNLFFYTGSRPLVSSRIDQLTCTNVQVIRGRPNLPMVIRNIIYGIESGVGVPQQYMLDQKDCVTEILWNTLEELDRRGSVTKTEKLAILADTATEHGFQLTNTLYGLGELFDEEAMRIQEGDEASALGDTSETMHDSPSNSKIEESERVGGSEDSWDEDKALKKLYQLAGGVTDRGGLYVSPGIDVTERRDSLASRVSSNGRINNAGLSQSIRSTTGRINNEGLSQSRRSNTGRISSAGLRSSTIFRGSTTSMMSAVSRNSHGSAGTSTNNLRNRHTRRLRRQNGVHRLSVASPRSIRGSVMGGGFRGSIIGGGHSGRLSTVGGMTMGGRRLSTIDGSMNSHGMDESEMSQSAHQRQHKAKRDAMLEDAMEIGFKPWEEQEDEDAEQYVQNLGEDFLSTWGLLYCGGSKIIEEQLKTASSQYGIELHAESFSW